MGKKRIDTLLVEQKFAESREQAKRLVLAGTVSVNGNSRLKPGQQVSESAQILVRHPPKYVSRGGIKLEKALRYFEINVQNRVVLDVGASTGGFTDCLLQSGAVYVYAVDVGYGQLAWKIRNAPGVQVVEKTNIRYINPEIFTHPLSMAVIDVSFISLRTVLPVVVQLLQRNPCKFSLGASDADVIALIKPQFEAGRVHVKKGGIVREKSVHIETIENLVEFVEQKLQATTGMGLTYSPIYQDIANVEYLLWLKVKRNLFAKTEESDMLTRFGKHDTAEPQKRLPVAAPRKRLSVKEIVETAHHYFYGDS